jgi:hypothetical protein
MHCIYNLSLYAVPTAYWVLPYSHKVLMVQVAKQALYSALLFLK